MLCGESYRQTIEHTHDPQPFLEDLVGGGSRREKYIPEIACVEWKQEGWRATTRRFHTQSEINIEKPEEQVQSSGWAPASSIHSWKGQWLR